ncbi:hypothetical protein MK527_11840, partial [Streptococcus gallolyticus subsp. gallolyticus]|nr:hypothetical protein [Streptococcus gallolyticus subsp. gallolyticus]
LSNFWGSVHIIFVYFLLYLKEIPMNLSQNTLKRFQNLYEMSQIPFTLFSLKDGPFYSFPVGLEKFYDVNFWK